MKKCPLVLQNNLFPYCEFAAERPILVPENCHPCSRIVWNNNVLREENEHRKSHEIGACNCGLILTEEERRRALVKASKAKGQGGKGRGRERGVSELVRRLLDTRLGPGTKDEDFSMRYVDHQILGEPEPSRHASLENSEIGTEFHNNGPMVTKQSFYPDTPETRGEGRLTTVSHAEEMQSVEAMDRHIIVEDINDVAESASFNHATISR